MILGDGSSARHAKLQKSLFRTSGTLCDFVMHAKRLNVLLQTRCWARSWQQTTWEEEYQLNLRGGAILRSSFPPKNGGTVYMVQKHHAAPGLQTLFSEPFNPEPPRFPGHTVASCSSLCIGRWAPVGGCKESPQQHAQYHFDPAGLCKD